MFLVQWYCSRLSPDWQNAGWRPTLPSAMLLARVVLPRRPGQSRVLDSNGMIVWQMGG